MNKDNLNT